MALAGATPNEIATLQNDVLRHQWFGQGGYVENGVVLAGTAASAFNVKAGGTGGPLMFKSKGEQSYAARRPAPASNRPYVTRIDPKLPNRPDPKFSIDSSTFSGGKLTSKGGIRNTKEFWQQWQRLRPESLSKSNRYLIENYDKLQKSPKIDDAWIKVFPEHAPYKGDTIIHHHVDFGKYAIPVPRQTHRGSGGVWHRK
jgi:hypothetical protein